MFRSHKIRLIPTAEQEQQFRQASGNARFAYNWALAEWNEQYRLGGKPSESKLRKQLNSIKHDKFPWMQLTSITVMKQAIKNLGDAFSRFFKRVKTKQKRGRKNPYGRPQFKKKGKSDDSFRADNGPQDSKSSAVKVGDYSVSLPLIGVVRMRENPRFAGRIISATVSRKADSWYVSFRIETDEKLTMQPDAAECVGVDLGVKTLATLSNGEAVEMPKRIRLARSRVRRLSKSLSRKVLGSSNRSKAKTKLARLHARLSFIRNDTLHKLTHKLATQFKVVAIETLNVSGMVRNRKLSRAISECGFYEFRRQLQYKCEMTGAYVQLVDKWYPSSKTCSGCGEIHEMPLAKRRMVCSCGTDINRDVNAAINLMRQALPCQPVESQALVATPPVSTKLDSVKQEVVCLNRSV